MTPATDSGVLAVSQPQATTFQVVENGRELLRMVGVGKKFGSGTAVIEPLRDVGLSVARGEMIAVLGPSGAGKSTLLHLLAALDTPTTGAVYFAGNSLNALTDETLAEYRNRKIGFVWQRHHLLLDFTAAENVAMPLLIQGGPSGVALERAREWLAEVGLADRANNRAGELSGGEQQRLAIARALVGHPELLLADEPTGNLDERNAEAIFELMERLHRSNQLTSILATHNLSLARRADRLLILEHGTLGPAGKTDAERIYGLPAEGPGAQSPEGRMTRV
jgi:lipoprotein-releasing system ATP-binding protein